MKLLVRPSLCLLDAVPIFFFSLTKLFLCLGSTEFPSASRLLDHCQLHQWRFIVHTSEYNWTKLSLCPVCFLTACFLSMKSSVESQRCVSVYLQAMGAWHAINRAQYDMSS